MMSVIIDFKKVFEDGDNVVSAVSYDNDDAMMIMIVVVRMEIRV